MDFEAKETVSSESSNGELCDADYFEQGLGAAIVETGAVDLKVTNVR